MLPYLDALQVFAVILSIKLIGFGSAVLKFLTYADVSAIRRLLTLAGIPAAMFRLIGDAPFNLDLFLPFFNSLLTQATLHLIIGVAICVLTKSDRGVNFLKVSLGATRPNYIFMGYPIVQGIFREDMLYVCAMAGIVHFLIVQPIEAIVSRTIGPLVQENSEELEDIELKPEDQGDVHESTEPEPEVGETIEQVTEPLWKFLVLAFVTPINVCTLLGLAWSATPWSMLAFMSTFVKDLEKSVVASGLFSIGVFFWEGTFKGQERGLTAVSVLSHILVVPSVSWFWSWVLRIDREVAAALVLVHAAPMAWGCLTDAIGAGMERQSPEVAFFWGNVLSLPVFMGWLAIINETGWFG
jgi:predicted permease